MPWFHVRAAVVGTPAEVFAHLVPDIPGELLERGSLRAPSTTWDAEEQRVLVEIDDQAPDPRSASGGVYDEVLEAAWSVAATWDTLRVEILAIGQL